MASSIFVLSRWCRVFSFGRIAPWVQTESEDSTEASAIGKWLGSGPAPRKLPDARAAIHPRKNHGAPYTLAQGSAEAEVLQDLLGQKDEELEAASDREQQLEKRVTQLEDEVAQLNEELEELEEELEKKRNPLFIS